MYLGYLSQFLKKNKARGAGGGAPRAPAGRAAGPPRFCVRGRLFGARWGACAPFCMAISGWRARPFVSRSQGGVRAL